ncbi:MAG: hypothetical protein ACE5EK_07785, partial [Nitrospinales bacterium]
MPTLSNIQGKSLVPDVTPSLNLLLKTFGTGPERRREEEKKAGIESAIQQITNGDVKKAEEGLIRIANLAGAPVAQSVLGILERGDRNELIQKKLEAEEAHKRALFFESFKDDEKGLLNAIDMIKNRKIINGEDAGNLERLRRMSPGLRRIAIKKQKF